MKKDNIFKYWNIEKDKSSPKDKLKMTAGLLLTEQVRKNLTCWNSDKNSDKITFRYYSKGEIRTNSDGSEPVYSNNSPADLEKDKFYESKEYDWNLLMSLIMMMIRGENEFVENVGKLTAEAVSDIVLQIEKENYDRMNNK